MLEGEISRLLSVNAEISQENIALRVELDNRPDFDGVQSVKHKLEQQMQFLGGLVEDLAAMQRRPEHGERPKMAVRPERTEEERIEEDERRMPIIHEDKSWRRESSAGRRSSFGVLDSPDLESPPVLESRMGEDPIKKDQAPLSGNSQEATNADANALPNALAMNLETRRKRRDSGRRSTITTNSGSGSDDAISGTTDEEQKFRSTAKLGMKRKLEVRDDDVERRMKTPEISGESSREATSRRPQIVPQKSSIREKRDAQRVSKTTLVRDRRPFGESKFSFLRYTISC
jgi:hypothetical protein